MKKQLITAAVLAATLTAGAPTPLWLRDVKISPDGQKIAFTYKGDIWTVPTSGGTATRLTSQPSYESEPVWSPDSRQIAFATDRNGGMDIYVMPATGGKATRLTSNSANETPEAFSPDGKYVFFSAAIQDNPLSALYPSSRLTELYRVAVDGSAPATQVLSSPAQMISFLPDGSGSFIYQDQKGMEDQWRKHHTSSITRDLWLYDAKTGKHRNLTARPGEDRNPVVSTDGTTVYFLSERDGGSFNVYSFPTSDPKNVKQLTQFETHPVRFLSAAQNGMMAMAYDGEIYTMAPGAKPEKVTVDVVLDEENPAETLTLSRGFSDATVSPDGKQIAVVKRGEVFVSSVEHSSTKQITHTPAVEFGLCWAPDNRTLYYTSERDGHWNIYRAKIARDTDPNFSNATLIDEEPLFDPKDGVERTYPKISPDGKKMAFIQDRNKLMVMDLASKKVTQLTDPKLKGDRSKGFNYSWSPDSKWIVAELSVPGRDPYTDIFLVNAQTGETKNLTESGYFDERPRFVLDGNAILFVSERYGMRNHASWGSLYDAMLIFLNQESFDKFQLSEEDYALLKEVEKSRKKVKKDEPKKDEKKKKKDKKKENKDDEAESAPKEETAKVELDGIENRVVRLTPNSSDIADVIIDIDGKSLYYLSAVEQGYDLWKLDLRKGDCEIVSKLDAGDVGFEIDDDGKIYLLGSSTLKSLNTSTDRLKTISVTGKFDIDPAAEREAMFNNVVFQEREMFYTPTMHGVDWPAMTEAYRRFLPHISNGYDFAELLSEMLGELNVSHTGGRYYADGARKPTASLGLLYDLTYDGDGLKVAEIVTGGPMDHADLAIVPGSVLEAINGQKITPTTDVSSLLNGQAGKKTLVEYRDPKGATHEDVVLPVTSRAMSDLMYQRWVRQREHDVDSLSGGRLGYVHLESMDDESFRRIYSKIMGKFVGKEGIVIDTRWNGGGRLHEDIEVLFSGDKYLTQVVRGTEVCDMPSRRWNKPSIMIQCEANYSNAHGTPWVYNHKGMGKLVGAPVPGTMTSVNWVTAQNPDIVYGIPVIGYQLPDGSYLENKQLEPDILVLNDPATVVLRVDDQLRVAVETLLHDLDSKK